LLLNQAIAEVMPGKRTVPWLRRPAGGFIQREIFPDSEMPTLGAVLAAAERQGFEVRDIESMREHYAQTLQHWLARFERRFGDAVKLVGERKARAWRLYLAASAVAFRLAHVGVYQTLFAKRTARGEAKGVPRSRATWSEQPLVQARPIP
jgi:cyclopropane-fatty-acyl-phospholipid synthase